MSIYEITFSPTGGTGKAAHLLTGALGGPVTPVDLTDSRADFSDTALAPGDVAVIAVPSYAGRVPAVARERLSRIRGGGARAVLLCVYGNRAYEDTLAELEDLADRRGSGWWPPWPPWRSTPSPAGLPPGGRTVRTRPSCSSSPGASGTSWPPGTAPAPPSRATGPTRPPAAGAWCPCPPGRAPAAGRVPGSALCRPSTRRPRAHRRGCVHLLHALRGRLPQSARQVDPQALSAVDAMLSKVCAGRKEGELYL